MIVLGLGANLGDRAVQLKRAITRLSRGSGAVLGQVRVSRIYESPALMPPGAPSSWDLPFLNCALAGETSLSPRALLARLQAIERSLGRPEHERWAPRPIDIDILWWDGNEMTSDDLTIPHPEILNRSFVLEPLRDLIPGALLSGQTLAEHASRAKKRRAAGGDLGAIPSPEAGFRVAYPTLMGIVNVTPDSFSDGGRFLEPVAAVAQAKKLVEEGAGIIDVGAESTRPRGAPVDPRTEWGRLESVLHGLRALQQESKAPGRPAPFRISLDSRNAATVRSALRIGVDILNDVTGFRDPEMMEIARETDLPLVFMHSLSIPVVKGESLPLACDPVEELSAWARGRLAEFDRRGISAHRLIFDPGIGFGKTVAQNWRLLEEIERFHDLGLPLLVGHSRKSFLEAVTNRPSADRDGETREVSRGLAEKGVEVLRVHDVKGHDALFRTQDAGGEPPAPAEL